jgi:hypothetical protein
MVNQTMKRIDNFARGAFLGALFGFPVVGIALALVVKFNLLETIAPETFRSDEAYFGTLIWIAIATWIACAVLGGLIWVKLDRRPGP